ncbi:E3 ubiquitin-protein ligase At3g02290 [Phragmites australis]|uniref:E3 ubiquitin-protein ligase At3g02290 n=1 Tax=Phragmites australis TaxID=29695 RepID=UPI002D765A63|nr:E3 ubiquitin-protein ligase At3g02290 [Phragmites australis]
MGALLCCLHGPDDGAAAAPGCYFCLPWPFVYHADSGSVAQQRGDTRVAPDHGRVPLVARNATGQVDSMDTFHSPPRPLPFDDPQFSPRTEQHPVMSGHDKASTQFQKPGQLTESKNTDNGSTCTAQKFDGSSVKYHSGGSRIDRIQACDFLDNGDDCPICLEEYHFENPKIALQCNHNFHLSCIYEWMERSQACPVCAKVMLFNEDE